MEVPKLLILVCCIYSSYASHHEHTIPVEGYETELQDLGQHVEYPETPVKVIKITKTIAVKVPVPYPVKVIEKVPYPVHISKPYPVPVPQIVHVPAPKHKHGDEHIDHSSRQGNGQEESYQVQEAPSHESSDGYSYESPQEHSFSNSGHNQNIESIAEEYPDEASYGRYEAPSHNYYGNAGNQDSKTYESKNYDKVIQDYLSKLNPNAGHSSGLNYYH